MAVGHAEEDGGHRKGSSLEMAGTGDLRRFSPVGKTSASLPGLGDSWLQGPHPPRACVTGLVAHAQTACDLHVSMRCQELITRLVHQDNLS